MPWGDEDGPNDLDQYSGSDFTWAGLEYSGIGEEKLILVDSDIEEATFRQLFNSFQTIAQIEEPDVTLLEVNGYSYGEFEFSSMNIDLSFIDRFSKLEYLKIDVPYRSYRNTTPRRGSVVGWDAVTRCPNLTKLYYHADDEAPNFDLIFKISNSSSKRSNDWLIGWCAFDWMNFFSNFSTSSRWAENYENLLRNLDMIPEKYWFFAQRNLIASAGMRGLEGYLGNPKDFVEGLDSSDLECAIETTQSRILELVENQVNNGKTLLLDIDTISKTKAAYLIPQILESRKREILDTVVPVHEDKADLRNLWLTSYGYQILSSLQKHVTATPKELRTIKKAFSDLGLKLKVKKMDWTEFVHASHTPDDTPIGLAYFIETTINSYTERDSLLSFRV